MIPVGEHRAQGCDQPVGDLARARGQVIVLLGQDAPQGRHAGAQHVHGMRGGRQGLEHGAHRRREPAQRLQARLVAGELGAARELAVDEQEGDLLELALLGDLENVVAAVMQVVARAPDGAERGVAGQHPRECHGFLRLQRGGVVHGLFPNSSSSFLSYS